jgi:DNA-3-methyladenine glycosylase
MFGPAGTVYIYRSYGIHWCMNFVTGEEGEPQGVLLRSGQVVEGLDTVERRRARSDHLTDGPGKLGQALGITGALSGSMLNEGPISLTGLGTVLQPDCTTPRIGISKAKERPWRFVILDS